MPYCLNIAYFFSLTTSDCLLRTFVSFYVLFFVIHSSFWFDDCGPFVALRAIIHVPGNVPRRAKEYDANIDTAEVWRS